MSRLHANDVLLRHIKHQKYLKTIFVGSINIHGLAGKILENILYEIHFVKSSEWCFPYC